MHRGLPWQDDKSTDCGCYLEGFRLKSYQGIKEKSHKFFRGSIKFFECWNLESTGEPQSNLPNVIPEPLRRWSLIHSSLEHCVNSHYTNYTSPPKLWQNQPQPRLFKYSTWLIVAHHNTVMNFTGLHRCACAFLLWHISTLKCTKKAMRSLIGTPSQVQEETVRISLVKIKKRSWKFTKYG